VLTLRVDPARLVRSRFALSRLAELSCALEVLTHPERAPFARGWVAATRPQVDPAVIALGYALVEHESWYVPDFLVPHPDGYEPTLDDELAAVAATPADVVRHQLELAFRLGPPPPAALDRSRAAAGVDPRAPLPDVVADVLAAGPGAVAERAAAELAVAWRAVLDASWPALRRVLDEDVRDRTARAGRDGLGGILDGLHPSLHWDGTRLTMDARFELTADADGGVVLAPSVFLPRPALWAGTAGQLVLGYPARGRGRVWSAPEPLSGTPVLGARRAALLTDLAVPRSTSELAARHRLSPATVSYHLNRLRAAGLVTSRQAGHSVVYAPTERATALLAAIGD
jgi:DNA-binding transcriptional ArsR family regulator